MSRNLRRGFKAEAEGYAALYRSELGLEPHDPLCPRILAEHLLVPVRDMSSHPDIPDEVKEFWAGGADDTFSAVIVADGTYKEIVHNDSHHPRRQNSNIAHELAHIILGHPLSAPIKSNGEREYNPEIEDEAKWLGNTLLLPKRSLVYIMLNEIPLDNVQRQYGVSRELLQYRVRVTGTDRHVESILRKRRPAIH